MSQALIAWLERRWYGGVAPEWPLRALAAVFGRLARRRRRRFLAAGFSVGVTRLPLIVVGNLTVGGAGKTPLTIALVEGLRARGWHPGVISRGHGGSARRARRVDPDSLPAEVGDEPLLIAQRTLAPVAVGKKRIEAATLLDYRFRIDVLIADDGLQHYRMARDIEILVVDGERRFGNGRLLPAGPLREPVERAASCDFRIINGGDVVQGEVPMQLELGDAVALDGSGSRPLQAFAGRQVHALAGIGNPSRFFGALRARGIEVLEHRFPDHHPFRPADLQLQPALPLLMTEKDAVKCRAFAPSGCFAVPVRAMLPETFFDAIDARLRRLAGEGA